MISLDDVLAAAVDLQRERQHKVPRSTLVQMYTGGMTVPEIAAETGLAPSTVRYHLVRAEVYVPRPPEEYRHVQPQKETCVRGHDLAEWGRPRKGRKASTRECILCCRIRGRESKKRRYYEKKAEQS